MDLVQDEDGRHVQPGPAHGPTVAHTSKPKSEETHHLEQLISATSPEVLEMGVQVAVKALDNLAPPLAAAVWSKGTAASNWLKLIKDIQARAKPTRTIVGVVGNTGAGKSSVINAVLDEERLLPTSCLRACTASPTEISYNYSEDPAQLYRAEVEFISAQDWIRDLEVLFGDLLDGSGGIARDSSNPETEAGIAYAKIKAVYPKKTKDLLKLSSPESLANEHAIRELLDTTKQLWGTTSEDLYRQLQHYVDSQEKNDGRQMEFWPLIKVVRIFTKAKALSTGAVIVDLPGVHDSNAARAAVATNYMKACSGLWIVAPITRAVDEKTAKALLGDSFRRQLKYDGSYSAITFICSKTDDISVTEASDSLNLEEEVSMWWDNISHLDKQTKQLRKELVDLKGEITAVAGRLEDCDDQYDRWEDLSSQVEEGKRIYPPSESSHKKRKRQYGQLPHRKKHQSGASDEIDDIDELSDPESDRLSASDKENDQPGCRKPLTQDQIGNALTLLKECRKELRARKKTTRDRIANIKEQMSDIKKEHDAASAEIKAICIEGRNEYSQAAIRHDFAAGIKELDEEAAIEKNEATFDPDEEARDYHLLAASLPVFCVSSRAYGKICGRFQRDGFDGHGFETVDDTEIPQLQAHTRNLTEAGRRSACRRILSDIAQLLNSMKIWASIGGSHQEPNATERNATETLLLKQLLTLEKAFNICIDKCMSSIDDSLTDQIYNSFDHAIPVASASAVATASAWSRPRSEGGMSWGSYRAAARRLGKLYSEDFNRDLFQPIFRQVGTGWDRAFQQHLPSALTDHSEESVEALDRFHKGVAAGLEQRGIVVPGFGMLTGQLQVYARMIMELPGAIVTMINDRQRDANREFTPVIQQKMAPAYQTCGEERGPGTYMRMKAAMMSRVQLNQVSMFRAATDFVKDLLRAMCVDVETELVAGTKSILEKLSQDYMTLLVGVGRSSALQATTPAERVLRLEMGQLLAGSDA